jgi:hypothetical protein
MAPNEAPLRNRGARRRIAWVHWRDWPDREYRKVERRPRNTPDLSEASAQRALRAGDLDACRIVLRQCEMPDDERAAFYCRNRVTPLAHVL